MGNQSSPIADAGTDRNLIFAPKIPKPPVPGSVIDEIDIFKPITPVPGTASDGKGIFKPITPVPGTAADGKSILNPITPVPGANDIQAFHDGDLSVKSPQKLKEQGSPNSSDMIKKTREIASEAMQEACKLVASQALELIDEPPQTFVASHLANLVGDKLNEQLEKPGSKYKSNSKTGSCGVGAASAIVEWSVNEAIDTGPAATSSANTNQAVNAKFITTCQNKYHCSAVRLNTHIDLTFNPSTSPSPTQRNTARSGSSSLYIVNNHNTMMTVVLIMILYHWFFNIRR